MSYYINSTDQYHKNDIDSLGWELTVCNSLEAENTPIRSILLNNETFGIQLFKFLKKYFDLKSISNILEVGGGYGFLMRDFFKFNDKVNSVMIDISEFLINKQKETLKGYDAVFLNRDIFEFGTDYFKNFEFIVLNENAGDFTTVCNINPKIISLPEDKITPVEKRIQRYFKEYSLERDFDKPFNFNIGIMELLEKMCISRVKNIFISEHSCEAEVPHEYSEYIDITSSKNPERILLKGHDEYTIKFSYLEAVAEKYNYKVIKGPFMDFIKINKSERINTILRSGLAVDDHEIIRHFIHDLIKYEYLLLINDK